MKKFLTALICLILAFGCSACGGNDSESSSSSGGGDSSSSTAPEPEKEIVHCLTDFGFERGFNLRGLDSATDSGVVKTVKFTDEEPVWNVAQWWSKHNLKDGEESITDTVYSLKDQSKKVEINRKYGSITLEINASEEFETFNPVAPAKWPHFLIEQLIAKIPLADAEKLEAKLDFTITKNEDKRGAGGYGFQSQFAWFIYIVDTNPKSEGFGNFLWFGLNIFDSTKVYAPASAQQDTAGGLGNFIYSLGANEFMEKRVKTNVNNRFSVDILPEIKTALETAQSKGFMTGTTVEDCSITGTNIGWEVFDRWDESITIFNMAIDKTVKE